MTERIQKFDNDDSDYARPTAISSLACRLTHAASILYLCNTALNEHTLTPYFTKILEQEKERVTQNLKNMGYSPEEALEIMNRREIGLEGWLEHQRKSGCILPPDPTKQMMQQYLDKEAPQTAPDVSPLDQFR